MLVQLSTIIYSQSLIYIYIYIYITEWTGTMQTEQSCPSFSIAVQDYNPSYLSRSSETLSLGYYALQAPLLTWNTGDFSRSSVRSILGTLWSFEHGNAREDIRLPELAIRTLHGCCRPYASVRDAHVEALTVVRVGGKPR